MNFLCPDNFILLLDFPFSSDIFFIEYKILIIGKRVEKSCNEIIAVCGLNCSDCDIYKAADSPELAEGIVKWFKKNRNVKLNAMDIRCGGCRGKRDEHWSSDCWILKCCVDEKGLEYCSECDDFPCDKLLEWSKESEGYARALNRLKSMS